MARPFCLRLRLNALLAPLATTASLDKSFRSCAPLELSALARLTQHLRRPVSATAHRAQSAQQATSVLEQEQPKQLPVESGTSPRQEQRDASAVTQAIFATQRQTPKFTWKLINAAVFNA